MATSRSRPRSGPLLTRPSSSGPSRSSWGTVIGLTFTFGFGNVLTLAHASVSRSGSHPLVAPAVDLSILGLLLGTRDVMQERRKSASFRRSCWFVPGRKTLTTVRFTRGQSRPTHCASGLRIGATRVHQLVALIRSAAQVEASRVADDLDGASEHGIAQAA